MKKRVVGQLKNKKLLKYNIETYIGIVWSSNNNNYVFIILLLSNATQAWENK